MTPTACSVMPRARVRRAARAAPTGGAAARAEFTGPKGSTGKAIWEAWLTLWLLRTRWVSKEWARAQDAKQRAAKAKLWVLKRQWAREDEANGESSVDVESERELQQRRLSKQARRSKRHHACGCLCPMGRGDGGRGRGGRERLSPPCVCTSWPAWGRCV